MSVILKAENISKQYRLGLVGTGTLSDDLKRWWYGVRGKEDPFLKVGAVNDRSANASEDYVWALRDINFEVKQGEVLGIIGKNGAGKSTLLKILSRVTAPTTGSIKTRGRIASLLEVGTGFHGELTGRENIFMNGAVLGMSKSEIRNKLDEIIAFSGCERYIDTPVKRYSSGMTVRLGFAVAAHLEPEILVVDEVLAVGDAEFQKKAIGKMQDLSTGEGRTVLFVSHNMASVENLCNRGLLLENGEVKQIGNIQEVVDSYLYLKPEFSLIKIEKTKYGLAEFRILNKENKPQMNFKIGDEINFVFNFSFEENVNNGNIGIGINTLKGVRLITFHTYYELSEAISFKKNVPIKCKIDSFNLMAGTYNVEISLFDYNRNTFFNDKNVFTIEVENTNYFNSGKLPDPRYQGFFVQKSKWCLDEN